MSSSENTVDLTTLEGRLCQMTAVICGPSSSNQTLTEWAIAYAHAMVAYHQAHGMGVADTSWATAGLAIVSSCLAGGIAESPAYGDSLGDAWAPGEKEELQLAMEAALCNLDAETSTTDPCAEVSDAPNSPPIMTPGEVTEPS
ncbi:hypothetical protein A0H81_06450 [Grifola frondosa]|uniref:Uncharacterized protein n=1 Tax=Grifola frondosa TaxID=5627 RepID=A0A1C7MAF4_GRIFR|nr:hypothetical protein A0H81_06450 [Grifola frondosa]